MKIIKLVLILLTIILPFQQISAKEFLNAFLHFNFGAAYSFPFGDILDYEHNNYSVTSPPDDDNVRPSHYDSSYSVFTDFTPLKPILLGDEAHAIKIGLRACYRMHYMKQKLTITNNDDEKTYDNVLIDYNRWMVGPVLRYAPEISPKGINNEYSAGGGFTCYILYGMITKGTLTGFPVQRDRDGDSAIPTDYTTEVSGFAIDIGIGGEISVCAINLGANIYYSYIHLTMDKNIYKNYDESQGESTNISKNTSISYFSFEVYIGIPIEW